MKLLGWANVVVHRSSYNYWVTRKSVIKPEKVKQLAEVKRILNHSNGSAGARTIAIIATVDGFAMSRYVDRKRMKELALVSATVTRIQAEFCKIVSILLSDFFFNSIDFRDRSGFSHTPSVALKRLISPLQR